MSEKEINLGEKYFKERMLQYGIDDEINQVDLWRYDSESKENVKEKQKVFAACDRGIEITVYSLDRDLITYKGEGSRWSKDYKIIRYHTPTIDAKGKEHKYYIPKGAGTFPFFPPHLIEKYEKKEKIKTLVLTEGYFKAFKAAMHGLDIVGLSSITHYKDKEKGTLHSDIIKLIKVCNIENVIWLADGDCNRISLKALGAGEDVYKRPNQFFNTCVQIKRLMDDYDIQKYFAYIDSLNIEGMPKGLDDLLLALPGKEKQIIEDLTQISRPAQYFYREEMSYSTSKIHKHFCLHNINEFVEFHSEQIKEITRLSGDPNQNVTDLKKKEFVYNGTRYRWNDEKSEAEIIIPGDAKRYFRVGDQYHEKIMIPNKYGELEKTFRRRQKQTIIDDYGKVFVTHIPKYKEFCNVPDHNNYQEVIHSCFNMYYPFEHEPKEDDFTYTMRFLKHIFGEKEIRIKDKNKGEIVVNELDLGLDYVQLLYQQPQQILPILCLVSKEQNTGKTTFAKLLKLIFTQNVAIVGNAELANDFNASWAGKLLVICDEAKIDKQLVVEKVKSLSTADKIFMNAKGKDHIEIDFFAKFLFMTNNEENFIYAGEDDVRYWIRKVPVITELFVDMLPNMQEEIPGFLDFLNKRKLKTERLHRAWFHPELIKTEALKKVIAFSQSTVEKEIRYNIREMFFDHGQTQILLTINAINETFFKSKYEMNYLKNVLINQLKVDVYHSISYDGKEFKSIEHAREVVGEGFDLAKCEKKQKTKRFSWPKWEKVLTNGTPKRDRVWIGDNGRPYVFHIAKFLTQDEIQGRWIDPEAAQDLKFHEAEEERSWGATVKLADSIASQEMNSTDNDLPF